MNTTHANYTTFNPYLLSADGHVNFATNQPNVFFKSPSNLAPGGNNVDESSVLAKSMLTNQHIKISLHERPYKTVPYLGKGAGNPDIESQLQQGQMVADKKSVATISEKSYMDYSSYPMMDDLKNRIGNPSYSIEEYAMDGWVRGGSCAREVTSDSNFSKNAKPRDLGY
jgi:hypothetical protein